jgi:predicted DsbA family dithiol-disulfide isomerase
MSVTPTIVPASSPVVTVEHWFDFICPFCYIAQDRNGVLRENGIRIAEHGLQIHPEIGPGGMPVGPRVGATYDFLAQEAETAGLPLNWSDRIPNSRPALGAFEWLNATDSEVAGRFAEKVFAAYFAEGRDIESAELLVTLAEEAGADADGLRAALATTTVDDALHVSEAQARAYGISGTPTWVVGDQQVSGLRPRRWFADLAASLTREEQAEQAHSGDQAEQAPSGDQAEDAAACAVVPEAEDAAACAVPREKE